MVKVNKEDNLTYEPYYMAAVDITPLSVDMSPEEFEEHTTQNVQLLVNHMFKLPYTATDDGCAYTLPKKATNFRLPRALPVPKVAPKTKWEKFAEEKGIFKAKRSRMVYSDLLKDWVPRWGPNSKKNQEKSYEVIKVVKNGADPYENPWHKERKAQTLVRAKQKFRELRNIANKHNIPK